MDEARFWAIIESGGREALGDSERQLEAIRQGLRELPAEELPEFSRLFDQKMDDAYTWDLWGAAYQINGGCSDDGFSYFRAWLICRGQAVYAAALRDPDSLAEAVDPALDFFELEGLWDIAQEVYEEKTGEELPATDTLAPSEPKGEQWDFDDDEQVSQRLPKLAAI